MEEEIAQAERDLRSIQMEEDRAIRLFVSGKITEAKLDHQRRFITERLESARAKLDDYRAQEASGAEKRRLMETVIAWARRVGQGLDELTPEQRKVILQMVVEQVVIDRDNNVDITLAIPIDDDSPEPESPPSPSLLNLIPLSLITSHLRLTNPGLEILPLHPQAGARRRLQVHAPAQGRPRRLHHRARRRHSNGQAHGGYIRERGRVLFGESCAGGPPGDAGGRPPAASGSPARRPTATEGSWSRTGPRSPQAGTR